MSRIRLCRYGEGHHFLGGAKDTICPEHSKDMKDMAARRAETALEVMHKKDIKKE